MSLTLVIVESPKKAKLIGQYLQGAGQYECRASGGHFCDLDSKDLLDRDTWQETYVLKEDKASSIKALKAALKAGKYSRLLLATDADREGEAISWHLRRELAPPKAVDVGRVRFQVISERAIRAAVANPTTLNLPLVEAYRARRTIDRVVGYDVSSAVRRLNAPSAGRVQSACLHLFCEKERAIRAFVSVDYWTVATTYEDGVVAKLVALPGGQHPTPATKAAQDAEVGADELTDEELAQREGQSGRSSKKRAPLRFWLEPEADAAVAATTPPTPHRVRSIESTPTTRKPHPPYTTSTFVQDAYRKYGVTTEQAMAVAQALYEAGFISYHRTDAVTLDSETVAMLRERIAEKYPEALPDKPPVYQNKASAQEGHEALRPSRITVTQAEISDALGPMGTTGWALWRMITARAFASQCKPAELLRTVITVDANGYEFELDGQQVRSLGFLHYWGPYAADAERPLPNWAVGDTLTPDAVRVTADRTTPPARYNEASFNKKIDALGIGRPSTLAKIIATLKDKGYITNVGSGRTTALAPTDLGLLADDALRFSFEELVTADYTANMEAKLDAIASGTLERDAFLRHDFYPAFQTSLAQAQATIAKLAEERGIKAPAGRGPVTPLDRTCPKCEKQPLVERPSKDGGTFVSCSDRACTFTQGSPDAAWKPGACAADGCGGTLVEYRTRDKKGTYWRCAKCQAFGPSERAPLPTLDKPCPKCGQALLVIPRKRAVTAKGTKSKKDPGSFVACQARCGFAQDSADTPWREGACPMDGCGGTLVQHRMEDRTYWKCARCNTAPKADGTVSKYQRQAPLVGCPRCASHPGMTRFQPRDPEANRPFDSCAACQLLLDTDAKIATAGCPTCGKPLVTRRQKDGTVSWACVGAPDCPTRLPLEMATARPAPFPPGPQAPAAPAASPSGTAASRARTTPSKTATPTKRGGTRGPAAASLPQRPPRRPVIPD